MLEAVRVTKGCASLASVSLATGKTLVQALSYIRRSDRKSGLKRSRKTIPGNFAA